MTAIDLVVVNRASVGPWTDDWWRAGLAAWQRHLDTAFVPEWASAIGAGRVRVHYVPKGAADPGGAWRIVLGDRSDQPGDLGYHYDGGGAEAKVFLAEDLRYGTDPLVTASHEGHEMLVNPTTQKSVLVGREYLAQETDDPVEADAVAIAVANTPYKVSNSVTRAYFLLANGPRYDLAGKLAGPAPLLLKGSPGSSRSSATTAAPAGARYSSMPMPGAPRYGRSGRSRSRSNTGPSIRRS